MIRRPTIYRSNKSFVKDVKSPSKESTRIINLRQATSSVSYPSNRIITSKYTAWNFIPKNLFEQFRRIGNFYFLCIATISLVIETPVSPVTSIAPLVFVIMVTAIKQGYEDYLRHKADREVNNYPVTVIRKGVIQLVPSKSIRVGDIVKLNRDQDVPCDLVLLISSNSESKCFVTTANLDGETDLKTLQCPKSLKRNCKTEEQLNSLEATIKCENPTPNLYKFHGRIEFGRRTSALLRQSTLIREKSICAETTIDEPVRANGEQKRPESGDDDGGEDTKKIPVHLKKKFFAQRTQSFPKSAGKTHKKTLSNVDRASFNLEKNATPIYGFKDLPYEEKASIFSKRIPSFLQTNGPALTTIDGNVADHLSSENLILRGSKLKNTEFVYGCAVYTGADTKLALNSKLTSNKFSSVEKSINKYLLFYLGLLIFMVIVSTALKTVMESKNGYGHPQKIQNAMPFRKRELRYVTGPPVQTDIDKKAIT
ncbi:hypothetical protein RUM43_000889 [Polyplax serrata]|uniref:P-type ATPase N-terminal domain-containing protein n=1 Tax=Polyplax serrata TaxID=468196 RepID=A0AAN8XR60_POLSC